MYLNRDNDTFILQTMAFHILELRNVMFFCASRGSQQILISGIMRVDVFVFRKALVYRFWDKFISDFEHSYSYSINKDLSIGNISKLLNKGSVCARYGENVIIRKETMNFDDI